MTWNADQRAARWLADDATGDPRWGCFSTLGEPLAAETLGGLGYDFVLIDLQHGMANMGGLVPLLQAVEGSGAAPLVRVRSDDPAEIGQALDLGAWAVVVPMIDSADQAARAVAAAHYPPSGTRSYGPFRGRVVEEPRRVLVMIETAAGLAEVEEIAAIEGLLGIFVGPSDLAINLGLPPDYEIGAGPHHQAIARIGSTCSRAGIVAAIQTAGAPEAQLRAEQGFRWISMRSDWLVMRTEASRMLGDVRAG